MDVPRPLHAIRLQAAWEPPREGVAAWIRRFGRPAGVDAGRTVWLVVVGCRTVAAVFLNGIALPAIVACQPRWAHDITALLRDRNVLEIRADPHVVADVGADREARRPPPTTFGAVRLEIFGGQAS